MKNSIWKRLWICCEKDVVMTIIIIIVIIIIIIIIISFMQGIYTYISETIYVPKEFCLYYSWCLYR